MHDASSIPPCTIVHYIAHYTALHLALHCILHYTAPCTTLHLTPPCTLHRLTSCTTLHLVLHCNLHHLAPCSALHLSPPCTLHGLTSCTLHHLAPSSTLHLALHYSWHYIVLCATRTQSIFLCWNLYGGNYTSLALQSQWAIAITRPKGSLRDSPPMLLHYCSVFSNHTWNFGQYRTPGRVATTTYSTCRACASTCLLPI